MKQSDMRRMMLVGVIVELTNLRKKSLDDAMR